MSSDRALGSCPFAAEAEQLMVLQSNAITFDALNLCNILTANSSNSLIICAWYTLTDAPAPARRAEGRAIQM